MSYDVYLKDKDTGEVIQFDENHNLAGGTYAIGGTREAWLNVTYNYGKHYYKVLGEKGIRTIYGMSGKSSVPILHRAVGMLEDNIDPDYWKPTEGNAKKALLDLISLAELAPEGIWDGD